MNLKSKWYHDQGGFHEAMGLDSYDKRICSLSTTYEILATREKVREFYPEKDDAPNDLVAKSAILQRSLGHVNERQAPWVLLTFNETYKGIVDSLTHYETCENCKKNPLKRMVDTLRCQPLLTATKLIKDLNYDWELFIEKSMEDFNPKSEKEDEIEKLIKNALGKHNDSDD